MRYILFYLFVMGLLFTGYTKSYAQIETRLATNCAMNTIEVPINVQNFENINSFQLQLLFDQDILSYDSSLYHHSDFNINNPNSLADGTSHFNYQN